MNFIDKNEKSNIIIKLNNNIYNGMYNGMYNGIYPEHEMNNILFAFSFQ
jgi:hypothetical protein